MDITITPKFLVGNVVKSTINDSFTGIVNTVGIFEGKVIKYFVEYFTSDGEAAGRWFDGFQLKSTQTEAQAPTA